jgi:hypothetical protein
MLCESAKSARRRGREANGIAMTARGSDRYARATGWSSGLGIAAAIALLIGCGGALSQAGEPLVLATDSGRVEFTFPTGWSRNEEPNPFALQALSRFERANTGVFEWVASDLAEDFTPRRLLEAQIADMRSKRRNFELYEEESEVRVGGKTLTSVVYAGELSSSRYLYAFTLITFDSDPELVLVSLQITFPSEW